MLEHCFFQLRQHTSLSSYYLLQHKYIGPIKPISLAQKLQYTYFIFLLIKSVYRAQAACGILLSAAVKFGLSLIPDPQSGGLRRRRFSQKLRLIKVWESSPAFQSAHFLQRDVSPISPSETHQEPNESAPHQKCCGESVRSLVIGHGRPQREPLFRT